MAYLKLSALVLLGAMAAGGCHRPAPVSTVVALPMGSRTFALEVASAPEAQQAGLSDRDSLPADQGLIYPFVDETEHFRMENARIPLDVIFVNSAGIVVSIHSINANDPTPVRSDKPAFYAIELNRGAAQAAGIKIGDRLSIPAEASRLLVVPIQVGNKTFNIEVARTADDQETGLMSRDFLPADRGMIFVFNDEAGREFWMKNTRIPLDILFVNTAGAVVSIHQMAPYDLALTKSDFPARYAIELNKGAADSAGAKVGDHILIPPQIRTK